MQIGKYLALAAAATASLVSAQMEPNGTILDMVTAPNNTLGVSKFVALVTSDSGYQPVIDLLGQPGNYTAFVPNDRVLTKLVKVWKSYARSRRLNYTGDYPPANFSYNNMSILDVVSYHVAGSRVNLTNLTANGINTDIVHSILNKTELDKLGTGLPILIESNASYAQITNQTWVAKNGQHLEYEVGNGLNDADVQYKDINTTNGYLNVIESILIPPVSPSKTIAEEDDLESFYGILKKFPSVVETLNNTSNFTLFAPNNRALRNVKLDGLSNQTIESILMAHVVPGVYYSTNITTAAAANNGNVTLNSINNATIPVYVNSTSGSVTLNNSIPVVDTNIFFNNGVMHIIQGVLNPPSN